MLPVSPTSPERGTIGQFGFPGIPRPLQSGMDMDAISGKKSALIVGTNVILRIVLTLVTEEDEEPPHGDNDDASMNDFDEFEEGEAAADDDFGDFDDGFQESLVEAVEEESTAPLTPQLPPASPFVVSSLSTSINLSAMAIRDGLLRIL